MRIPFLRSYTAFSSQQSPSHAYASDNTDLEKDAVPNAPQQESQQAFSVPPPDPSSFPSSLIKFQNLTGISVPPTIRSQQPGRPAPNLGIYKRVIEKEAKVKFQYKLSAFLVNLCYLLQIIVGAALTALGAANAPSGAVTFLGALNTILAGLLTYLKGQGLPQRLEQYFHLLRMLREHIEERERNFSDPGCTLDVDEEIERVVQMHAEVKQTAQDNSPGNVLPPRGNIASLIKIPDIRRDDLAALQIGDRRLGAQGVMAGLREVKERFEEGKKDVKAGAEGKKKDVRNMQEKIRHGILEEVEEHGEKAKEEIERLEKGLKNL